MLELVEDELGRHQGAVDKARVADVRDPAVDDDARVEDLAPNGIAPAGIAEDGQVHELLAPFEPDGVADVAEHGVEENEEEDPALEVVEEHVPQQAPDDEAQDGAQEPADVGHGVELHALDLAHEDDEQAPCRL